MHLVQGEGIAAAPSVAGKGQPSATFQPTSCNEVLVRRNSETPFGTMKPGTVTSLWEMRSRRATRRPECRTNVPRMQE